MHLERLHDLRCNETRVIYAREMRRISKVNTYLDCTLMTIVYPFSKFCSLTLIDFDLLCSSGKITINTIIVINM